MLVTDASARDIGDPLARDANVGTTTLTQVARDRKVTMFTLHLQTPQAARISQETEFYNDIQRGETQYRGMQMTGDRTRTKYFRVRGNTQSAFAKGMDQVASDFVDIVGRASQGEAALGEETEVDDTASLLGEESMFLSENSDGMVIDEDSAGLVSDALVNEIFRYQQDYLGRRTKSRAPDLYRGWASDRDLIDPRYEALDVSVLITRNQLSDLASRLVRVVERVEREKGSTGAFFDSVQDRTGKTVIDPQIRDLLPEMLAKLPYKSDFLKIDRARWVALGESGQSEQINAVKQKIEAYRQIARSETGWIDLGSGDTGEAVYALPLTALP